VGTIFNTPGIGGLVAVLILGIFTGGYFFTLRWILKGEERDRPHPGQEKYEK
jgi:hypothetical protein